MLKLNFFTFGVFLLGIPSKYACCPIVSKYCDLIPGVLGSNPTPGSKISEIVKNHFFIILNGFDDSRNVLQRFDEVKTLPRWRTEQVQRKL